MAAGDYRVPDPSTKEDTRLGYLRELRQTGEQYLKSQRAYPSLNECLDLVLAIPDEKIPADMSRVRVPRAKRNIRELVSILSNLRPTASNKTDNPKYFAQGDVLNKLDRHWWYNCFADRSFRTGFQTTAVLGTAYVGHTWDPDFNGRRRKGDIRTDVWGPEDVYLVYPPRDHDLQRCYGVGIKTRAPIHLVQAKYPLRAHQIVPDHGSKAWTQKGIDVVQSFMSSPLRALTHGIGDEVTDRDDVWPTVDVIEWYFMDLSLNMTGHDVDMGDTGTSWHYRVPSYGTLIPTGMQGWEGLPLQRRATADDAMLYPLRRKIVQTSTVVLSDGSSEWWHGKVPITKFAFDDWPWEALGFPLARDVAAIEEDNTKLLRAYTDSAIIRLDPPFGYDENLVSERLAERMNLRQPRQRLRLNMSMGDAVKPLLPPGYADLPESVPTHIKQMEDREDYLMGVRDLVAMAKAKQVPSADSLEKIMEMAGPLAQDITRSMERGMRDLGEMRRYLNFQFRTSKQLLQVLGENGMAEEVFDYDPGNLIPSHLPDEDPDKGESRYTIAQRARWHADNFYYHIVPHSMARLHQMGQKLILLQLEKGGFPLDPWTKAEMFEIDNFGHPPAEEESGTILQRWILWQEFLAKFKQNFEGAAGHGETRGRKPSGSKSPKARNKSGGTRSSTVQS